MTQNTSSSTDFIQQWISSLMNEIADNDSSSLRSKILERIEENRSTPTGDLNENGLLSSLITLAKEMEMTNGD